MRQKREFENPFKRIWSSSLHAKNMRLRRRANQWFLFARLAPTRGAYRDRHERWVRDAVDADGALTKAPEADGEVVWS
jgi:hypothetical protein